MQRAIKTTYYVILTVFGASAIVCLAVVTSILFPHLVILSDNSTELPYLGTLLISIIIEAAGVVFIFVRQGLKHFHNTETNKKESETLKFMCNYIKHGATVTIVSNGGFHPESSR
jgi:hypothetical protein